MGAALIETLGRAETAEEGMLRSEAETQNHRKRLEREQRRLIRMANEELVASCARSASRSPWESAEPAEAVE